MSSSATSRWRPAPTSWTPADQPGRRPRPDARDPTRRSPTTRDPQLLPGRLRRRRLRAELRRRLRPGARRTARRGRRRRRLRGRQPWPSERLRRPGADPDQPLRPGDRPLRSSQRPAPCSLWSAACCRRLSSASPVLGRSLLRRQAGRIGRDRRMVGTWCCLELMIGPAGARALIAVAVVECPTLDQRTSTMSSRAGPGLLATSTVTGLALRPTWTGPGWACAPCPGSRSRAFPRMPPGLAYVANTGALALDLARSRRRARCRLAGARRWLIAVAVPRQRPGASSACVAPRRSISRSPSSSSGSRPTSRGSPSTSAHRSAPTTRSACGCRTSTGSVSAS